MHYFYGADLDIPKESMSTASHSTSLSDPSVSVEQEPQTNKFMCLPDFWELHLVKITEDRLRFLCKRQVRQLKFKEMISVDVRLAIKYLQEELSQSYDLSTEQERTEFHSLSLSLFIGDLADSSNAGMSSQGTQLVCDARYMERSRIFDKLVSYFPESMTQPKTDLVDLIFVK